MTRRRWRARRALTTLRSYTTAALLLALLAVLLVPSLPIALVWAPVHGHVMRRRRLARQRAADDIAAAQAEYWAQHLPTTTPTIPAQRRHA